jgi:hypothetical protein
MRTSSGWKTYGATEEGLQKARFLEKEADPRAVDYVRKLVKWARSVSFKDLVKSIYQAYPEMKANSIFRD